MILSGKFLKEEEGAVGHYINIEHLVDIVFWDDGIRINCVENFRHTEIILRPTGGDKVPTIDLSYIIAGGFKEKEIRDIEEDGYSMEVTIENKYLDVSAAIYQAEE